MAMSLDRATKNKFKKFLIEKAVQDKSRELVGLMKELDEHETRNELLENVNERLYYSITDVAGQYQQIELEAYRNINNVITDCSEPSSCGTDNGFTSSNASV